MNKQITFNAEVSKYLNLIFADSRQILPLLGNENKDPYTELFLLLGLANKETFNKEHYPSYCEGKPMPPDIIELKRIFEQWLFRCDKQKPKDKRCEQLKGVVTSWLNLIGYYYPQDLKDIAPYVPWFDNALTIFEGAINKGMINKKLVPLEWRLSVATLAYLCGKVFCNDVVENGKVKINRSCKLPAAELNRLFGTKDLSKSRIRLNGAQPPIWHEYVDELLNEFSKLQ